MRLAPAQHRAYTYKVTAPPATLAVLLQTVKDYLKRTTGAEDALITIFIQSAIEFAEQFTRRDFITRTYETFRDFFPNGVSEGYYAFGNNPALGSSGIGGGNVGFELRRSVLQTVDKIEYLKAGVLTLVDSAIFYNTLETDYSEVLTVDDGTWPLDADRQLQAVKITFKTGFGDGDTDMPSWVTEGVMQHVADMWANRGDCGTGDGTGVFLPATARLLYLQNRIENL